MIVPGGFWSYADFRQVDDQGRPTDLGDGVNTRSMFFHNFGAMHGVFEYYRATGEEPELPARIWARFEAASEQQRPAERRAPFHPRPSWQDEYDAPELSDYFAPWRPRAQP